MPSSSGRSPLSPKARAQQSACLTALLGAHFPRLVAWLP
ncbi:rCG36872 [Rattus norvegicus]|uniref:RCG36872 n=1 Tax=Rattus norvegicus TaxID=10116 RepID=A6HUJ9_RAT|nr:rCG36872 [Rattus norvegicus]